MSLEFDGDAAPITNGGQEYELFQPFALPRHKLDADQYMAEDLHGVTESLFGSGNLNYFVLQSGISGSLLPDATDFTPAGDTHINDLSLTDIYTGNFGLEGHGLQGMSGDLPSLGRDTSAVLGDAGQGGFQNSGQTGSLNTAALFESSLSDVSRYSDSGGSFISGNDGADGVTTTTTNSGNNGRDGTNGGDGQDGTDGNSGNNCCSCDGPIINIEGPIVDIDFGDVTQNTYDFISTTLDQTLNFIQDIQIFDIVNTVLDITYNLTAEITNILDGAVDLSTLLTINLDAVVGEITDVELTIETLNDLTTGVSKTVDLTDLTDTVDTLINLGDFNPLSIHTFIDVLNADDMPSQDSDVSILANLDVLGADLPDITQDINLDPVEMVVGDIDLDIDIVQDIDPLNTSGGQDTDLALDSNIIDGMPDVNLVIDPVEDIVGDIDISGDLNIDLLQNDAVENDTGDTDITLQTDIDLVDDTLADSVTDIELDAVEDVIGDVDLDLTTAADLLGDTADPLVDGYDGGSGNDTLLSAAGDLLEDTVDAILPDVNDEANDTDLLLDAGADVTNDLGIDNMTDVTLDTVEDLTHDTDIDADLDGAISLLDSETDPIDNLLSEGADGWTETTLVDADNIFSYGTGSDSGLGDVLPEVDGTVGEGIGGLDFDVVDDTSAFGGGLFG